MNRFKHQRHPCHEGYVDVLHTSRGGKMRKLVTGLAGVLLLCLELAWAQAVSMRFLLPAAAVLMIVAIAMIITSFGGDSRKALARFKRTFDRRWHGGGSAGAEFPLTRSRLIGAWA